jgi:hypothetical protein
MTPIEAARNFLALLYLAMKGRVELQQIVNGDDKTSSEDIIISRMEEKV